MGESNWIVLKMEVEEKTMMQSCKFKVFFNSRWDCKGRRELNSYFATQHEGPQELELTRNSLTCVILIYSRFTAKYYLYGKSTLTVSIPLTPYCVISTF